MDEKYAMKKLLLTLMLSVVSSSAMAEWVYFTRDSEETVTVYVDTSTIRKTDNGVKIWIMFDFKKAKKRYSKPHSSYKERMEYDCKEELVRSLYQSMFTKNMGAGGLVETFNVIDKWAPIEPESINDALWKFACGK